jgi:hypothetical protein
MRGMLIGVTVICVLLGLQLHRAAEQKEAAQAIRDAGGWVYYDYQQFNPRTGGGVLNAHPSEPDWMLRHLGVDFFHDVRAVNMSFDETAGRRDNELSGIPIARHLARFRRLEFLGLNAGNVDDEGMKYLGTLKHLDCILYWDADEIGDAGVAHLVNMPRLRSLHLGNSQVGDEGLRSLARLKHLERLTMQRNNITDAGVAHLADHPGLKSLWIGGLNDRESKITDAGVVHLATIPNLEELDLQYAHVTPGGLKPLQKLTKLKALYLSGSQADDYEAVAPMFPGVQVDAKKDPLKPR